MNPNVPAERVESLKAAKVLVHEALAKMEEHSHLEGAPDHEHIPVGKLAAALLLILEKVPD